ncbi:tyrosine-type recombinase/integrase [Saccharopolyspora spinosa]|uniref:tyrosine-type recombinase/integrase n=1 Tax=Saccharopolyspora spinosa TaxID=60894 RepID=UPI0003127FB9|nr:tyrosine-type recombinase/integrase [Saccharopolyspora spinosa]
MKQVPNGTPLLFDREGRFDWTLNRFILELPELAQYSEKSWLATARDIDAWVEFLRSRGEKSWLDASLADARAYKRYRLSGPLETRLTAKSWNRHLNSLDKLYNWAVHEKLVDDVPFRYRTLMLRTEFGHREVKRNTLRNPDASTDDIKFLSLDDYLFWRDVGLRGQLPDGSEDPSWRGGRFASRTVAFAELLVTTGMRLEEASVLLVPELPAPKPDEKSARYHVAAATVKYRRGRYIRIPHRVLGLIRDYLEVERANVVAEGAASGRYTDVPGALDVVGRTRAGLRMDAGSGPHPVSFDDLDPRQRERLFHDGTWGREPLLLWLSKSGKPWAARDIQETFETAAERCRAFGRADLYVSPHTLRHTFAVHQLSHLIRIQFGSIAMARQEKDRVGWSQYARMLGDPLDTLRRALGHRHVSSTFIYLTNVDEAQWLTDEAAAAWANEVGAALEPGGAA